MALVMLGGLPGRTAPAVISTGLGPLSLLGAGIGESGESPLTYEGLHLVLEVDTVIGVMAMVLVKAAVFGLVLAVRGGSGRLWPLEGVIPLNLIKYVLHGRVKGRIPFEPTGRSGLCRPVGTRGSVGMVRCLIGVMGSSGFRVLSLVSVGRLFSEWILPSSQGILGIHVFLGFGEEGSHGGRRVLGKGEKEIGRS